MSPTKMKQRFAEKFQQKHSQHRRKHFIDIKSNKTHVYKILIKRIKYYEYMFEYMIKICKLVGVDNYSHNIQKFTLEELAKQKFIIVSEKNIVIIFCQESRKTKKNFGIV